jgi:DNA repair exonuclease SbcCD ATPase subunit
MSIFPSPRPRVACLLAALAAWTLSAAAPAQASPEDLAQRYPKGSFSSVEQADQALQQVQQERAAVEAEFADAQYACYSKFFSTPCVDHAKDRRREALNALRAVEVDAQAYKRREKVAERDNALQQQADKDTAEAPDRTAREKANEEKAAQRAADRAARAAAPPPGAGHGPATPKPEAAPRTGGRDRVAEHEAKLREEERESAAGAAQRAQNVAEYRRKQEEAKERQRRAAEKVADRERKLKEKAAHGGAPAPAPADSAGR